MENQNGNHWERPTIQNNFYGNIGQQINHVDKIEAHFDKNMGIEVDGQDILKDRRRLPRKTKTGLARFCSASWATRQMPWSLCAWREC